MSDQQPEQRPGDEEATEIRRDLPPLIAARFTLASGETLERRWFMGEDIPSFDTVPPWIENPRKSWTNPQDPITFTGVVQRGSEAEARAFLDATPTERTAA